jgi:ABC-type sugar transport system ATPase subunit
LGDVTVVSVEAGGETLRMVLPESAASGLQPGQPASVVLDPAKFHIFRASSGQVIA